MQHDPGARADAADADDLARGVDEAEALEQPPAVAGERAPVGADHAARAPRRARSASPGATSSSIGTISGGSLTIRGSPSTISVSLSNACRLSFVRAFARFFSSALASARRWPSPSNALDELLDVDARVPDVEVAHRRRSSRIASRYERADRGVDRRAPFVVEAAVAAGDGEARDEPLDVPLERARAASRRSR